MSDLLLVLWSLSHSLKGLLQPSSNNPLCRVQLDQRGTQSNPTDRMAWGTHSNHITLHHCMRQPEAPFVTTVRTKHPLLLHFVFNMLLYTCTSSCTTILVQHSFACPNVNINITARHRLFYISYSFAKSRTAAVHASASNSYYSAEIQLAISFIQITFERLPPDLRFLLRRKYNTLAFPHH